MIALFIYLAQNDKDRRVLKPHLWEHAPLEFGAEIGFLLALAFLIRVLMT
jgi:hypothetical protein